MGKRQPAPRPSSSRRQPSSKSKSCPAAKRSGGEAKARDARKSITETAIVLDDDNVALALAELLPSQTPGKVRRLMRRWMKPILKVKVPGRATHLPTKAMLEKAKEKVLRFYRGEEALGDRSVVVKAFLLASRERSLRFDWDRACERVRNASFDMKKHIDSWDECLAMSSGDTNFSSEIFVCGTKKVTLKASQCHSVSSVVKAGADGPYGLWGGDLGQRVAAGGFNQVHTPARLITLR
ncbi:unnamed protein product [Prorocentrum cordatum]|uniref:Uncharacterized protein n=1 Tax=Prorocentrum cordatum TaxID=2364126 RepID=A0ABN9T1I0_9DINO|nr:unnamed protein product [Polarella glacialis]